MTSGNHQLSDLSVWGRSLASVLLLTTAPGFGWCSETPASEPPRIQREVITKSLPPTETANRRIFVSFDGSPKMTRILQEKLRAKGFAVVDAPSSADARFRFNGTYIISALAKGDRAGPGNSDNWISDSLAQPQAAQRPRNGARA
jgi:hypothetical protein